MPFLLIFCVLSGILTIAALLLSNNLIYVNIFLIISILSFSIFLCGAACFYSGLIVNYPYLHQLSKPFFYLAIVSSFLYIRSVIHEKVRIKKYDFIHILPFLFQTTELILFYNFNLTIKQTDSSFLTVSAAPIHLVEEGQPASFIHLYFMLFVSAVYYFFQVRLFARTYRSFTFRHLLGQPSKFEWFFINLLLNTFLLALLFAHVFTGPDQKGAILEMAVGIYLLSIFAYIFYRWLSRPIAISLTKPERQSDSVVGHINQEDNKLDSGSEKTESLSIEKRLDYRHRIESFLNTQKAYLKKGYTLKALSEDVNLPHHHVSAVINREFNMNFNDYINQYRIKYIQTIMLQPESSQLTLEGLAWQAGFSSRSTFFRAFTKFTNLTPSEYINSQQIDAKQGTPL